MNVLDAERARFLARIGGVLYLTIIAIGALGEAAVRGSIAGVCYVINSFALLLSPPLSSRLFPAILIPALIAELSLALWLLSKGVNAEEWDRFVESGERAVA